jgi:hypothetical protein
MSFVNAQVPLEALPKLASVELQELSPRYARVVLGATLLVEIPALLIATIALFAVLVPKAGLPLGRALVIEAGFAAAMAALAWFAHKSASVIRYAVREHDVIVRAGVFWKKETIQPINRIQHVEQHRGPIDRRFGLYELKLFSAGTGHFTFRIPGLDAAAASRIKRFISSRPAAPAGEAGGEAAPARDG